MSVNKRTRIFWNNKSDNEMNYWLDKLSIGLMQIGLPFRKETQISINEFNSKVCEWRCHTELSNAILKLCKKSDLSMYTFFLTSLKSLLYKTISSELITIVSPLLRKPSIDTGDDILKNTKMILSSRINTHLTFKELLNETREDITSADKNRNLPMELIFEKAGYAQYDVMEAVFVYENLQDLSITKLWNYNFMMAVNKNDDEITIKFYYNHNLYEENYIHDFGKRFIQLIDSVLKTMDIPLSEIDIISEEEKQSLVKEMSIDSSNTYENVVELFEKMVNQFGDLAVLKEKNNILTYIDLNKRSNNLAHWLISHNASGQVVGLLIDNSFEMIIGILGILKAGASYIPISPEYPEMRVEGLLNDCNAHILITKNSVMKKFHYTKLSKMNGKDFDVYVTNIRKQILDLNNVQIPDRSLVNYGKYSPYIGQAMVKNSIAIQFSRGCMYNCAYCFKIWPNNYVIRTAENIFEEMKLYYDIGVKRFTFVDDLPNFNVKESSKLFQMIIDSGMKVHLHFPNGIRGDILSKEYIDLMVKAGTVTMDLALETSSPRLQKLIGKNLNIEKLKENVNYIIEKYPQVILELQILHGLPTETEEEALDSLELMKSIKWIHFPYIHILKIYPNTNMARIAIENGMTEEVIEQSDDLGYHELPKTLPFEHSFTKKYQASFVQEYFLNKERLLYVLPHQMKVLTEDELVQKYNSYLPIDIKCFEDLLKYVGIDRSELKGEFLPDDYGFVEDISTKMSEHFKKETADSDAKKILLLDLTQFFSKDSENMYDVIEPPLGLMYLLTSINRKFGEKVNGRIAKSRIDFDSYEELKELLDEFKPDVIGIRSMNYFKEFFHKTVSMIREWGFNKPILAGGPYATCSYSSLLADRNVDIALIGEGEITINELLEVIFNNNGVVPLEDTLKQIDGIAFVSEAASHDREDFRREIMIMDDMEHMLKTVSNENPTLPILDISRAYLIYTSGTTGMPKGVQISHGNLANQIQSLKKKLMFKNRMNYILLTNFTFDVSIMHIFLALTTGSRLSIISDKEKKNFEKLWDRLCEDEINIVNVVPTFMEAMIENYQKNNVHKIQHLFIGGETFSEKLLQRIYKTIDVKHIYNVYGPTETTINTSIHECDKEDMNKNIPIGTLLDGYQAYVLDRDLNLLPKGYIGQLYVGGKGLSEGYINDTELTNTKFISNPFQENGRLYVSGDLAKWNQKNELVFHGRVDHQVKLRGYRIELDEIRVALELIPEIMEAAVLVEDNSLLHGYVVTKTSIEEEDIKGSLKKRLPEYMIPSFICRVDRIPMTMNGKIDRKALLLIEKELLETRECEIDNKDPLILKVADMWCDILELDHIGVNDNFFDFGGHSLKAASFIARVKKEFKVELEFQKIFEHPTIKEIVEEIKLLDTKNYMELIPVDKQEYYEISSAQKRILIASKLDKAGTNYNMPMAFKVTGNFDGDKYEDVIKQLIKRHEGLRTSFGWKEDRYVQIIQEDVHVVIEKRTIKENEIAIVLRELIQKFDYSKAPLIRTAVLEINELEHILFIDMSHIIADGTSLGILAKEFTMLYDGQNLEEIVIQYKDFTTWQDKQLKSEKMTEHKEYWLNKLALPLPENLLPYDMEYSEDRDFKGDVYRLLINNEDKNRIDQNLYQNGLTLYMYLVAVYSIELSLYSNKEDIVVGTPVAGRLVEGLNHTLGTFVNMIPMRNKIEIKKEIKEVLMDVRKTALEAYEHQDYPFDEIVTDLKLWQTTNKNPLFNSVIELMNIDMADLKMQGLHLEQIEIRNEVSKFDLTLHVMELNDSIEVVFEYSTDVFTRGTIEAMALDFKKIIQLINSNLDITVNQLREEMNKSTHINNELHNDLIDVLDYNF